MVSTNGRLRALNPSKIRHLRSQPEPKVTEQGRPPPPPHTQAGLLKAVLTTTLGLYIGAFISQKMAAFLEENELFVPEDDEDDD